MTATVPVIYGFSSKL